jgi:hypothetical protein
METLSGIRDRMLPMLELAADRYRGRVPEGYPHVIDAVDRGMIGLEIDPDYALYITSDGKDVVAEFYRVNPRTDNRAGGARQKFAGAPFNDTRALAADISDQELRNLIAELMSYYNFQPGLIHISDD